MWENHINVILLEPCPYLESAESTSIIRMAGQVPLLALQAVELPFELVDCGLDPTFEVPSEEDSEFVMSLMNLIPSAICTYYKNGIKLSDGVNKRIGKLKTCCI